MSYVARVVGTGVDVEAFGDTPEEAVEALRLRLEQLAEAHADLGNEEGATEH